MTIQWGTSLFVLPFVIMVRISWKSRYMAQGLYMETDKKWRYHFGPKIWKEKKTGDYSVVGR